MPDQVIKSTTDKTQRKGINIESAVYYLIKNGKSESTGKYAKYIADALN